VITPDSEQADLPDPDERSTPEPLSTDWYLAEAPTKRVSQVVVTIPALGDDDPTIRTRVILPSQLLDLDDVAWGTATFPLDDEGDILFLKAHAHAEALATRPAVVAISFYEQPSGGVLNFLVEIDCPAVAEVRGNPCVFENPHPVFLSSCETNPIVTAIASSGRLTIGLLGDGEFGRCTLFAKQTVTLPEECCATLRREWEALRGWQARIPEVRRSHAQAVADYEEQNPVEVSPILPRPIAPATPAPQPAPLDTVHEKESPKPDPTEPGDRTPEADVDRAVEHEAGAHETSVGSKLRQVRDALHDRILAPGFVAVETDRTGEAWRAIRGNPYAAGYASLQEYDADLCRNIVQNLDRASAAIAADDGPSDPDEPLPSDVAVGLHTMVEEYRSVLRSHPSLFLGLTDDARKDVSGFLDRIASLLPNSDGAADVDPAPTADEPQDQPVPRPSWDEVLTELQQRDLDGARRVELLLLLEEHLMDRIGIRRHELLLSVAEWISGSDQAAPPPSPAEVCQQLRRRAEGDRATATKFGLTYVSNAISQAELNSVPRHANDRLKAEPIVITGDRAKRVMKRIHGGRPAHLWKLVPDSLLVIQNLADVYTRTPSMKLASLARETYEKDVKLAQEYVNANHEAGNISSGERQLYQDHIATENKLLEKHREVAFMSDHALRQFATAISEGTSMVSDRLSAMEEFVCTCIAYVVAIVELLQWSVLAGQISAGDAFGNLHYLLEQTQRIIPENQRFTGVFAELGADSETTDRLVERNRELDEAIPREQRDGAVELVHILAELVRTGQTLTRSDAKEFADTARTDLAARVLAHIKAEPDGPWRQVWQRLHFPYYYRSHLWLSLPDSIASGCLRSSLSLLRDGLAKENDNETGDGPLHLAARHGSTVVIIACLIDGYEPNLASPEGETPLHVALRTGHPDCASVLLASGADPNAPDNKGFTPLLLAVTESHGGMVRRLLKHGANPNCKDPGGGTPLHLASMRDDLETASLLLDAGADPTVRNSDGLTALKVAKKLKHRYVADLLREAKRAFRRPTG